MRLIDADGLKLAVSDFWKSWNGSLPELLKLIDSAPTIDAAPVVHGEWVPDKATIKCTGCGFGMFKEGYFFMDGECFSANDGTFTPFYCPNCGARMDGDTHG